MPQPVETNSRSRLPRVVIATTAMLSFISFWRAAAIVLNDLGSSAFYAGAIAEHAIGKSAPWFILAIMVIAYAVAMMYVESCSMFVRGGVYRVVKEAMGSKLAKFSVSALMFDYILTGPISGVSAGLYLVGLLNEVLLYFHSSTALPTNLTAATFAILVTLYFWRENVKGIVESSEKALRIMQVTTVMVVMMMVWAGYTIYVRGAHLPPFPSLANLTYSRDALGWLTHSTLPRTIGLIGILIGLGHSVLAMSGEETMAQVYREIEHPKLQNLKKSAFIIFFYSLIFTAGVAFLAVMIIPDKVRPNYFDNLIGGLAMNFVGPFGLRLGFQIFVVVVGVLMLGGAVNTAIVGSNGVLNRVSEDGLLSYWFRKPHRRYGTSHRILHLVAGVQIAVIILSRGNIFVLGEAYAFGVMWSFAMKALGVVVLRYTQPEPRGYRVPLNFRIGKVQIPLGLGLLMLTLFALCTINLFTKEVATISGIAFTTFLFGAFTVSERMCRKQERAQAKLDQFNLEAGEDLTPGALGVRQGNVLVSVRDYNTLYNLSSILARVDARKQDVVLIHLRLFWRAGAGEHELEPEQLFSVKEQTLFTRALSLAEKEGKTIRLAVAAASEKWDGMLRAAQSLQSSAIVLGASPSRSVAEEARIAGLAWERLPEPRPRLTLEIFSPGGQESICYLGPHAPHLTDKEIDLLHNIWLEVSAEVAPEEVHHHDVIHFALDNLRADLQRNGREEILSRLRRHLREIRGRRGMLKVFLGYASGVGKSLRMFDEARRRLERGEDVVVGATQPAVSPQVEALTQKMEVIPLRFICGVQAMDVEAILRRRPQVCVVDGLAYDNPPTCRHSERWEDVEELLAAGISILASVNLQYIDEYKERVEKVTGKPVTEVVPLDFLRSAAEIEVVDAPPGMTFHREGESPAQADGVPDRQAVVQQQKLGELREMALLLTADIVDRQLETYLQRHGIEQLWGTQERVLVCVKAGVNAYPMIESGRRNADRFRGEIYVVNVRQRGCSSKDESLLEENLRYARTLQAHVETIEEGEWTEAVLRFAHDHRITQIFIHHSRNEGWLERLFGSGVDRLIRSAEGIDIRVFP